MKFYTIGYGGRNPQAFVDALKVHRIAVVVDVRLRPENSSMSAYARTRDCNKGIEGLLARSGIDYIWLLELGNVFLGCEDWRERYKILFGLAGHLLAKRVLEQKTPLCLMCAEKNVADCHRCIIADYLADIGHDVEHIL